jgi:hypothetical protein
MSTENNSTNINPPEGKLGLDHPSVKINKRKRYIVTEDQLKTYLETKIENKLAESISFDTDEDKLAFIKPGNIITFKNKLPGLPVGQIAISKIQRNKSGAIKLINPFGTETPWFSSEEELLQAIDWQWMLQNIILKHETSQPRKK